MSACPRSPRLTCRAADCCPLKGAVQDVPRARERSLAAWASVSDRNHPGSLSDRARNDTPPIRVFLAGARSAQVRIRSGGSQGCGY
jgi:hypothetical protein